MREARMCPPVPMRPRMCTDAQLSNARLWCHGSERLAPDKTKETEMARNSGGMMIPTPKGGGLVKILIGIAIVGFIFLMFKHPTDAAGMTTDAGNSIGDALDSVATFVQHLR